MNNSIISGVFILCFLASLAFGYVFFYHEDVNAFHPWFGVITTVSLLMLCDRFAFKKVFYNLSLSRYWFVFISILFVLCLPVILVMVLLMGMSH